MSERSKSEGSGKAERKAAERRRLSAALRENLKRRKAQSRGRETAAGEGVPEAAPHDSAGFAADKQSH